MQLHCSLQPFSLRDLLLCMLRYIGFNIRHSEGCHLFFFGVVVVRLFVRSRTRGTVEGLTYWRIALNDGGLKVSAMRLWITVSSIILFVLCKNCCHNAQISSDVQGWIPNLCINFRAIKRLICFGVLNLCINIGVINQFNSFRNQTSASTKTRIISMLRLL